MNENHAGVSYLKVDVDKIGKPGGSNNKLFAMHVQDLSDSQEEDLDYDNISPSGLPGLLTGQENSGVEEFEMTELRDDMHDFAVVDVPVIKSAGLCSLLSSIDPKVLNIIGELPSDVREMGVIHILSQKILDLKSQIDDKDIAISILNNQLSRYTIAPSATVMQTIHPNRISASVVAARTSLVDRLSFAGLNPDVSVEEVFDVAHSFDERMSRIERVSKFCSRDMVSLSSADINLDKPRVNKSTGPPTSEQVRDSLTVENIFPYQAFIDQIMSPESFNLVDELRKFLSSVLGPVGDGRTPPTHPKQVDYTFYGTHNLLVRYSSFLETMDGRFKVHHAWQDFSSDALDCCRDHLERYIMNRIAAIAFAAVGFPKADTLFSRKMQLLSFLKPEHVDIKPEFFDPEMWAQARYELKQINCYKTPAEKIDCVVKSASCIYNALTKRVRSFHSSVTHASDLHPPSIGADDFLPTFIWVVLTSNVPCLPSNCEFIEKFHNPARMMSKAGYCLIHLRSAVEFINVMDTSMVNMDPKEFHTHLIRAERELNGGF